MDYPAAALERICFDPGSQAEHLAPIPWPDEPEGSLAPTGAGAPRGRAIPPAVDVLVITWTAAEGRALADVLTPGVPLEEWAYYRDQWEHYAPQLTTRSPAREEHRLGSWATVSIAGRQVCCFKSELHPATDAASLPTAQLVSRLAHQTSPKLVITTGTAGGAGDGTLLGDINVATAVRADFTTRLKGQPWSAQEWVTTPPGPRQQNWLAALPQLAAANAHRIPPQPRAPQAWQGHTVSTDWFCYDTADNAFGLRTLDPQIRAVEMDDAAVALGASHAGVPFASVRDASDPVMPDATRASAKEAESIYRRYGYFTAVNSVIGCWALIAGLEG